MGAPTVVCTLCGSGDAFRYQQVREHMRIHWMTAGVNALHRKNLYRLYPRLRVFGNLNSPHHQFSFTDGQSSDVWREALSK